MGDAEALERSLLQALEADGEISDSGELAASLGVDCNALVGPIKSLLAHELIVSQVCELCERTASIYTRWQYKA
jgi:DNA-binding MarR family transcriptional regulator